MEADMFAVLNELGKNQEFRNACENKNYSELENVLIKFNILEKSKKDHVMNAGYYTKFTVAAMVTFVGVVAAIATFVVIMPSDLEVKVKSPLLRYILSMVIKYSDSDFSKEAISNFEDIENNTLYGFSS